MGDFNLNHKSDEDQEKLTKICGQNKISALHEITHPSTLNQLDYILVDKEMKNNVFVTSFFNFISDHNSIVARLSSGENWLKSNIKEKLVF